MKAVTAAVSSAGLFDSGTQRQAPEPGAATTAVSMGAGVAEVLGVLAPELAGRVEAEFGRGLTGQVAGGFDSGFTGRVAGVFGAGFYVVGDHGAIFAVLGPRSWPGPLHLVTASLPGLPAAGKRVTAAGTTLAAGGLAIDFGGAQLWDPDLPDGLDYDPTVWAGAVPPVEPDLAPVWDEVKGAVRAGDLASACRFLEGRGGGLTPAGDDALAGIMLVAAADRTQRPNLRRQTGGAAHGDRRSAADRSQRPNLRPVGQALGHLERATAADRFQRPNLRRLAVQARTSELSRAFLEWAARGASIEPAHAVLEAAASGDRAGLVRAARTLAAVGASSGRTLLAGLALAVSELPPCPAGLRPAPAAVSPSAATSDPASPSPASPRPGSVGSAPASANRLAPLLRAEPVPSRSILPPPGRLVPPLLAGRLFV